MRFSNRYGLLEEIGRGGMGVVWRARDERVERDVAIKVLHPWIAEDPEARLRFRREARTLARLAHANVVRLYDFDEEGRQAYLVMELVEGHSLDLCVSPPLPEAEASRLLAPVADALAYAHARGVVHRDLKPQNILVEPEGRVVVSDFGLARLAQGTQSITATGVLVGSPEYWSPEQAAGRPITSASDVYALGCILYELVTSHLPFEGEDRLALGYRRVHEDAPDPGGYRRDLDSRIVSLLKRLLARDPAGRPDATQTAHLLRSIDVATARTVPLARVAPTAETPASPRSGALAASRAARGLSRAFVAGFISAAVLAAIGGLVYVSTSRDKNSEQKPLAAVSPAKGESPSKKRQASTAQPVTVTGRTVKIVSDLPMQGADRVQTEQMVQAIRFLLDERDNRAGPHEIQFEAFDDATVARGEWDEVKCAENARTYAEDVSIVGVIGTYNSGCAAIEMPILNEARVAMVSPANTYPGLTRGGPGTEAGEPDKYHPTGVRNYTRVSPPDDSQGKVAARYMKNKLGTRTVFILDDTELYGKGVADSFEVASEEIGLEVVGHLSWDKDAANYRALMTKILAAGADGIYISGLATNNGGQLIRDKVAFVGSNERVPVVASDGFVLASLFDEAGVAAIEGIVGTAPLLPPEAFPARGRRFMQRMQDRFGFDYPEVYTGNAVAAAEVLLDAIARSDGSREDVLTRLLETDLETVIGRIRFDRNGDPERKWQGLYRATSGEWTYVGKVWVP